ncbi:MAG: His/Gly/Thr/Pro-type tRNA ligase C-terminal domain-containing protein [Candidatus Bathyarchaeota archaeon]|nr:His/Gly/Thr/Pro-type tRNA ligase C-terminal domain-containing protein [Candidatus Bathyarchaeota archaeon]
MEKFWISYIVVVRARGKTGDTLPVRVSETGKQQMMKLEELVSEVREKTADTHLGR